MSQIIFDHLIQPATVHPWRVSRPSTTLDGRGVGAGKAEGISCKKTGNLLRDNESAGRLFIPGTCFATIEKSCLASKKKRHRNIWAINLSLQYPEDNTDTTAMLSQLN